MKKSYRIRKADGRIKYVGTNKGSWFSLEEARKIVDRSKNETIVEGDGMNILWEIF